MNQAQCTMEALLRQQAVVGHPIDGSAADGAGRPTKARSLSAPSSFLRHLRNATMKGICWAAVAAMAILGRATVEASAAETAEMLDPVPGAMQKPYAPRKGRPSRSHHRHLFGFR